MKKALLVLVLAAVLVIGACSMALGAVHQSVNDTGYWFEYPFNASGYDYIKGYTFPVLKTDTWFTITPEPSPLLYAGGYTEENDNKLGVGYLVNDFTFAEFVSAEGYNDIKGSYLFGNHIFAGMEYYADKNSAYNYTYLSLGYLFSLGGYDSDSYIALSADYDFTDYGTSTSSGLYCYEVNSKYYGEKSKFLGQVMFRENYDDPYLAAQYNWAICDGEIVLAIRGVEDFGNESYYFIGGTWVCSDRFVIDALYGDIFGEKSGDEKWYVISGMFNVNGKLYLGAEYDKMTNVDDEYYLAAKARYNWSNNALTFYYRLGNDAYNSQLLAGFQKQL